MNTPIRKYISVLGLIQVIITVSTSFSFSQKLPMEKWQYIQVDSTRQKWGDFAEPEWLRYFGLDAKDVNKDGYLDLVSGRYFYLNPGSNMEARWKRTDFGMNVDGYLFADVDGDELADIIALALPNVYWLEAGNKQGSSWNSKKVGEMPKTGHVDSQGYRFGHLIKGTKGQLLFAVEGGIHVYTIPENPLNPENWKFTKLIPTDSDEGIGIGDIDGMTVFGFGRDDKGNALLTGNQKFVVGLYPEKINDKLQHQRLSDYISKKIIE